MAQVGQKVSNATEDATNEAVMVGEVTLPQGWIRFHVAVNSTASSNRAPQRADDGAGTVDRGQEPLPTLRGTGR